ncbi:amphoterin-induced protein 2 [Callorhinchus milii]|uniref:Adhesion molecule with Ig like domain 2 n=1 Tax=Callorhinchus milii TaxID=7868 RepID=A0A4W3JAD3_CALMI|nr:amphoterin-induced protein 2 [Callorhinchus milii]|eukprot:gi/632937805/ref/XP_007901161.1/ PREDICTED: amphoterin-induced protein 2 [Callorhinchus milii]
MTCSHHKAYSAVDRALTLKCQRFVLLLLCVCMAGNAALICPPVCICASDIVTCTNRNLNSVPRTLHKVATSLDVSYNSISLLTSNWAPVSLDRLRTLNLNHNNINAISRGAFCSAPQLKYLDLSSNRLTALDDSLFEDLNSLETLLLYNNQIARVSTGAFEGLHKLQKLYLSQNLISHFPLQLYMGRSKLPLLELLDLSFNKLTSVPVLQLSALPARLQSGLYLHANPFTCDCSFYTMVTYWYKRQFTSVMDFKDDYSCNLQLDSKRTVSLLLMRDDLLNCSNSTINGSFHALGLMYEAHIGDRIVVNCDSKILDLNTNVLWVTPTNESLQSGIQYQGLQVFLNGSLEIQQVQPEDEGIYSCIAINSRRMLNETIEVTLKVHNFTQERHRSQTFNTAFTTLSACLASIILVLIYLYLTPCRCWCKSKQRHRKPPGNSARSSILSTTPSHDVNTERKASTCKRVVFLEPVKEPLKGQNGKIKFQPHHHIVTEKILRAKRAKCDSDSISSVFSDNLIVA